MQDFPKNSSLTDAQKGTVFFFYGTPSHRSNNEY